MPRPKEYTLMSTFRAQERIHWNRYHLDRKEKSSSFGFSGARAPRQVEMSKN